MLLRIAHVRSVGGRSLWNPGADWQAPDRSESPLTWLPSSLWLIGLGNLGQAFAWVLATLPYADPKEVRLVLQDDDRLAKSNDSTSLLSFVRDVGHRKARKIGAWLDARGVDTYLLESTWTTRTADDPAVALCGVDNPIARAALEHPGFGLVVEAGLGAGSAGGGGGYSGNGGLTVNPEVVAPWQSPGSTDLAAPVTLATWAGRRAVVAAAAGSSAAVAAAGSAVKPRLPAVTAASAAAAAAQAPAALAAAAVVPPAVAGFRPEWPDLN